MQVRGRKHLEERKAAMALEVKVPEDIEAQCCGNGAKIGAFPS